MCGCCCRPMPICCASLEQPLHVVAELELAGHTVRILECRLPGTPLRTWLVDHPLFSERAGNPYHDDKGEPWPDNADRFMLLSRVGGAHQYLRYRLGWRPDILHCNDWHTGPAIALAHLQEHAPAHGVYHSQPGPYGHF